MSDLVPVVSIVGDKVVTSSRDVAAYFRKSHKNILRDIDALLEKDPAWGRLNFEPTHFTAQQNGETYRAFVLSRDAFTILVMGFTGDEAYRFKRKYIEAFNAMEAKLRTQSAADLGAILNDPATMRGILLHHVEKRIEAEAKVAELTPKAQALERIAATDGLFTLRDAAKVLGQKQNAFIGMLIKHRWIYRQNGSRRLSCFQDKINRGLVEHKIYLYEAEGGDKASNQPFITPKGMAVLAKKLGGGQQLGFDLH